MDQKRKNLRAALETQRSRLKSNGNVKDMATNQQQFGATKRAVGNRMILGPTRPVSFTDGPSMIPPAMEMQQQSYEQKQSTAANRRNKLVRGTSVDMADQPSVVCGQSGYVDFSVWLASHIFFYKRVHCKSRLNTHRHMPFHSLLLCFFFPIVFLRSCCPSPLYTSDNVIVYVHDPMDADFSRRHRSILSSLSLPPFPTCFSCERRHASRFNDKKWKILFLSLLLFYIYISFSCEISRIYGRDPVSGYRSFPFY